MSTFKAYSSTDFACKCCRRNEIVGALVRLCNDIFQHTGRVYPVSSGFRCSGHNKKVGGSDTSSHMKGLAVDLLIDNSHARWLLLKALVDLKVKRYGVYKSFVHIDIDPDKDQELVWVEG